MKKKLILIAAAFFCFAFQSQAQKAKITGKVSDANGSPVKSATIMLYHLPDSALVKTDVTDASGNFELDQVKNGQYFVTYSFVGMQKVNSAAFTASEGRTFELCEAKLTASDKSMQGVVVTGTYKKPLIEVKADKTVFNVESSINATGSNAFELLQKSPGVITDKDDNISLKGKSGVRVYIDGRQVYMNNTELAAYLRSINSMDIESIEMITNPSARYDAAGNAGIINIKFKKNKKYGLNGSFSQGLNVGKTPKTTQALGLNYRNKGVNLFSNYSNSWGENESDFYLYRAQAGTIYDQTNKTYSKGWNHNIKAGMDIFASKEQTIGFIVTTNLSDMNTDMNGRSLISDSATGRVKQILYSKNLTPTSNSNLNLNFNYRFADSAGHEFNIDANRGAYRSHRSTYQPNDYFVPYPETYKFSLNSRNTAPSDIDINTLQLDYSTPFKKGVLGVGAKISSVKTTNDFQFYDVLATKDTLNLDQSSKFAYKENVTAAYVNYNRNFNPKWAIQAGLRLENTHSVGDLTSIRQGNSSVDRNYTNLFPSAAVTYNANPNHALNLTYSRRIDRPNYQDLNPFQYRIDNYSYQKGNPFLRPQYTNSIEFIHTYKYRYSTTIGYSYVSDFKAQIPEKVNDSVSALTQKNIASQKIYNINFSLPFQIKKWWSLYANVNTYHSSFRVDSLNGNKGNLEATAVSLYMSNTFTLGDGFSAEVSGFYNSPSIWAGIFKSKALGNLDLGVQKLIFNNKATVKISYTDLLRTFRWAGTSELPGLYTRVRGNWESQQLRLNFSWRFGNNQVKAARQRKVSSEEESKRLNSSGGFGGN